MPDLLIILPANRGGGLLDLIIHTPLFVFRQPLCFVLILKLFIEALITGLCLKELIEGRGQVGLDTSS